MSVEDVQSDVTKSKRRWFQYSLRTLFVSVTIFCCWMGWETERARRQARSLDAFRQFLAGEGWSDCEWCFVQKPRQPVWLWSRIGEPFAKKVVGISVPARNAESAMGILNEMPYLQEVSIQGMYTRESQRQRAETEVAVAITRGRQAMPRVNVTGVLMRARD